MRKNLMRALKFAVSVGLIAYLIYVVDWPRAAAELHDARLPLVIVAALIFFVNTVATPLGNGASRCGFMAIRGVARNSAGSF